MKRLSFILLGTLFTSIVYAQLNGDGYYRIRNSHTNRYISIVNNKVDSQNKSLWQVTNGGAHLYALKTMKPFSRVVSDPGSIIYISSAPDGYVLRAQGLDTKNLTGGRYLKIYNSRTKTGAYWLYATDSGTAAYLKDKEDILDYTGNTGYALANTSRTEPEVDWDLLPIDGEDQYVGITPEVSIGNKHYATIYASFPFVLSAGMKAYYVKQTSRTMAEMAEVSGNTIPAATPVIIECNSTDPAVNRVTLLTNYSGTIQNNILKGIYFSFVMQSINGGESTTDLANELRNVVPYDPTTMRVLGVVDGELGFVTATDMPYLPANKAYLTVSTDAAETLKLVDEETFAQGDEDPFVPTRFDTDGIGYMPISGGTLANTTPWGQILDNDATTSFGGDAETVWAIIEAEKPVRVKQYSIVTGSDTYQYSGRNPRSWKLEGSNDNANWTVIDEHVDDHTLALVSREEFVFPVNDATEYKYFRYTTIRGIDDTQIAEFWINEQAHTWSETPYATTEATAATCLQGGDLLYECTDCHVLKRVSDALAPLDHHYADGTCTRCSMTTNDVVLLPHGQQHAYTAKFRHYNGVGETVHPADGWTSPDFNDADWDDMVMPIGSNGYDNGAHAGAHYNTIWYDENNTYCFRRTFELEQPFYGTFTVNVLHDDGCIVYVNGEKVYEESGKTTDTNWHSIHVDPLLLRQGKNVVAVYIEQHDGNAYHDLSLTGTKTVLTFNENADNQSLLALANHFDIHDVELNRSVKANAWNTIVLPFNLTQNEIECAFGANARLAAVNAAQTTDEAVAFTTTTEGLIAGHPYLLWATKTVEAGEHLSFSNIDIVTDAPVSNAVGNDLAYAFTGIYDRIVPKADDYVVAADNTFAKSDNTAEPLKAFHAYMKHVGEDSTGHPLPTTFTVDSDFTGIILPNGDAVPSDAIYTITGQKVMIPTKGIYIVNGKKVFIQ